MPDQGAEGEESLVDPKTGRHELNRWPSTELLVDLTRSHTTRPHTASQTPRAGSDDAGGGEAQVGAGLDEAGVSGECEQTTGEDDIELAGQWTKQALTADPVKGQEEHEESKHARYASR